MYVLYFMCIRNKIILFPTCVLLSLLSGEKYPHAIKDCRKNEKQTNKQTNRQINKQTTTTKKPIEALQCGAKFFFDETGTHPIDPQHKIGRGHSGASGNREFVKQREKIIFFFR